MKLHDYLAAEEISIGQFAEALGVSHETVRRYVRGDRRPDWPILARITQVTDGAVEASDFFDEAAA